MKKLTLEEAKEKVKELVGDEYIIISKEFNGTKKPIKMRHNSKECRYYKEKGKFYEWEPTLNNFLNKNTRCPKCAGNKTKTQKEFENDVYNLVGNEYTVLSEYISNKTPIKMRHNSKKCRYYKETGKFYEYEVTPNHFLGGQRCKKCNEITTSFFKQEVFNLVGDEYTVLGEYIDDKTPIKIKHNCDNCNNYEWSPKPYNFKNGTRCPKCGNQVAWTHDEFLSKLNNKDEFIFLNKYENSKTVMEIIHKQCNTKWKLRAYHFLQYQSCPKCNSNRSKEEEELFNFISSLYKNNNIEFSVKNIISPYELDVYISEKNIAIEFDGLYWHSDLFKKDNYHLDKTNKCKEKNIRLIHIFEDEWLNKNDIVKSKLSYILNENNNPKIYARKCYIKEISSKLKNNFLNKNHIQGEDKANIRLGLFTKKDNKLVSVMSLCKPRKATGQNKNSKYDYELSRFASDINYIVIGAFSKLFSYFKNNYEWNKIITYADKRWSEGNVYIKNGWTHIKDSKPNYWYCNNITRYHRYSFRKSELKKKFLKLYDENLTEFQIMDKTNYTRIYDCGNMIFEYIKK